MEPGQHRLQHSQDYFAQAPVCSPRRVPSTNSRMLVVQHHNILQAMAHVSKKVQIGFGVKIGAGTVVRECIVFRTGLSQPRQVLTVSTLEVRAAVATGYGAHPGATLRRSLLATAKGTVRKGSRTGASGAEVPA